MVENGAQMETVLAQIAPPKLWAGDAAVTLSAGFDGRRHSRSGGKTGGRGGDCGEQLAIKWIVPFHTAETTRILSHSKKIIIQNNFSGAVRALPALGNRHRRARAYPQSMTASRSCADHMSTP